MPPLGAERQIQYWAGVILDTFLCRKKRELLPQCEGLPEP
jgi:hypothetical protein